MLISKCTHVNLKKTYRKILYLYQAYNGTFVFLGSMGPRKDFLAHVDKSGKQLFYHEFGSPMDTLGMMNQYQAVTLQTRANCISILDLKTHQFKRLPHYFMNFQSDQCSLFTFPDTKYMTIVEYGRYNDNRLKLTYYNYPQKNPVQVENRSLLMYHRKELLEREYESQEDEWTYEYQVVRGNTHSMVIWYKARHDEVFEFKFYRQERSYMPLHQFSIISNSVDNGWNYKCIRITHNFKQLYNFRNLNLSVNEVMEIQQDKFMVCCLSNRDRSEKQGQPIRNTYVVDLGTSMIKETPHDLGQLHPYQIDVRVIGNGHMIRTFQYRHGVSLPSPVFYFSNSTFELISSQEWVCSYRTKYISPGYDSFVMLQNEYQNHDIKQFKCIYRKLVQLRQIMLFLMLQMNQDFDEDLMNDVIQLTRE